MVISRTCHHASLMFESRLKITKPKVRVCSVMAEKTTTTKQNNFIIQKNEFNFQSTSWTLKKVGGKMQPQLGLFSIFIICEQVKLETAYVSNGVSVSHRLTLLLYATPNKKTAIAFLQHLQSCV